MPEASDKNAINSRILARYDTIDKLIILEEMLELGFITEIHDGEVCNICKEEFHHDWKDIIIHFRNKHSEHWAITMMRVKI